MNGVEGGYHERPLENAVSVMPKLAAIREKAKRLHQQGKLAEALQIHGEALRLVPSAIGIWLSAARLAHTMGLQEVSLPYFEQAARLDPYCYPAIDAARRICIAVGLYDRALHYSQKAYELNPAAEILVGLKLIVPAIARSIEGIHETRLRYEQNVDAVLRSNFRLDQPDGVLGASAFFLAYQGEMDKELQIKTARMFLHAIPNLAMTAPHCIAAVRRPGKIRIGFISRFFCSHSIFATSRGLIEKLSRKNFEVYALRITPSRDDDSTRKIREAADFAIDLDADIYKARDQVAALELDILFYQDIGKEPTSYFLAFSRLAPVQCVSFGHPNTTGISTIDYFISNDLYETENSHSHYSETLYILQDLPTLAYYYRPTGALHDLNREDFGLPVGKTLYVCPQTLYKVHPDFDRLVRGILERDPNGIVIFINGQFAEFTDHLRERLVRGLGPCAQRVIFLQRMGFQRFLRLLAVTDVVLDTIHFNGMNSSLEAFSVGTPIVTLPTELQRGRHTQAMYKRMQIFDCIAKDDSDYVEIAVRLGTDKIYAGELRERIRFRSHVLFEDYRVIEEFERFFFEAFRAKIGEIENIDSMSLG